MTSKREIVSFQTPLSLDSGEALKAFEIAYEAYGALNLDRSNAVLICHGLTAGAHAAGPDMGDGRGQCWWDAAIGPGKPFDTDRYFVICPNVIGGCGGSSGPSSLDPETGRPFGLRFPVVTIGDMVAAQARLSDHLGIERYHAIAGGCMGGFQVMGWMARFSQRLSNAIIITVTPSTSAHTLGLWEVMRQALMGDPDFNGGDYYDGDGPISGQGLVAMFGMMIWMSRDVMEKRFGRRIVDDKGRSYTLEPEFEVQAFLHRIGSNAGNRFDANSLIYLTKAMDYFDLARGRSDLAEAFRKTRARTLLISYTSDWRYPAVEMDEIRVALEKNGAPVEHRTLKSDFGHGAFIYDSEGAGDAIRAFLGKAGD